VLPVEHPGPNRPYVAVFRTGATWALAIELNRYGLALNSPYFIPKKNAMTEKTIIEGRTIIKTVEGVITDVRATVATATTTTSGTTEGRKSNSISEFLAGPRKSLAKQIRRMTD
jgi:hypothetical protein